MFTVWCRHAQFWLAKYWSICICYRKV